MKKTKVFFFCPSLVSGGLERVLSVLSFPFSNHYDAVVYINWHNRPIFYYIDERVRVISVEAQCMTRSLLKRALWLRTFLKKEKPDVLVSFSDPFNMIALFFSIGVKTKVIISERNDPDSFRWGKLTKILRNILYLRADGIIVQTKTSQEHLWNPLKNNSIIIPNPIMMTDNQVGSALLSEKRHLIVSVSRLVYQKRIDLVIKVFSVFLKTHPDYKLIIYGDGRERDKLIIQISALNLGSKVELLGVVNDIWDRIKCAEMFVIASEYEGMSNALLESMILGLPCISTKVSGAVDIIEHGKNGWLVDVNDEKGLLNAMVTLADNETLRREIGEESAKEYDTYRMEEISNQWIDYIDNIISK